MSITTASDSLRASMLPAIGIYLPERGFGVRIEDEVLMLPNGKWKLLTAGFPRKLEDVEAWVAAARR